MAHLICDLHERVFKPLHIFTVDIIDLMVEYIVDDLPKGTFDSGHPGLFFHSREMKMWSDTAQEFEHGGTWIPKKLGRLVEFMADKEIAREILQNRCANIIEYYEADEYDHLGGYIFKTVTGEKIEDYRRGTFKFNNKTQLSKYMGGIFIFMIEYRPHDVWKSPITCYGLGPYSLTQIKSKWIQDQALHTQC